MQKGKNKNKLDILGVVESIMENEKVDPEAEPTDADLKQIEEERDWDIIRCVCGKDFSMLGSSTEDGRFKCPVCGRLNG